MDTDLLNNKVLRMMGNYLNNAPDFIKIETVNEIAKECNVSCKYAFLVMLAAACEMDIDNDKEDNELFNKYFVNMVHELDTSSYYSNDFYKNIKITSAKVNNCELCIHKYKPSEAFVCNDFEVYEDGRIIPQIGFFREEFLFPAIMENGRIWMTITPNEIETMKEAVDFSYGNVLTYGLGLGYFTYMVSNKSEVNSVTVIEYDTDIIEIFNKYILPQFKYCEKVKIIKEDAFEFARKNATEDKYDFVFADLWHDVSDGLEMYKKLKKLEPVNTNNKYMYWIEKTMKCYIH